MEKDVLNEVENNEVDYDKALNEGLDKVKAEYEAKLAKEKALNVKLMKTITSNQKIDAEASKPEMTREQKLARHKELVEHLTSADGRKGRDLVEDSIEFRHLTKELFGVDPMLIKVNSANQAEDSEILKNKMDKVENKFQECLDNSDNEGDFLNEIRKGIDASSYPKAKRY